MSIKVKATLKTSIEHPIAAKIRDAIGASPTEEVEVVTPQFEREEGEPTPVSAPSTPDEWRELAKADLGVLREMGLRPWCDEGPWLFPGEWYDHIPEEMGVVDIFGATQKFERGVTDDDDTRFGMLSFGIGRRGDNGDAMPLKDPKPMTTSVTAMIGMPQKQEGDL